jgi:opacity protein-like surface antigen
MRDASLAGAHRQHIEKRRTKMRKLFCLVALLAIALLQSSEPALAASDIGLKGIGPRLGYVDPEHGLDGTIEFGADFKLGTWVKQLHWDASATYWSSGWEYPGPGGSRYDWSLSDFAIRTGVNYHFMEGEFQPFAGGGLGVHFLSWEYDNYPYPVDNSDSEFGLYIDGGVEYHFNPKWVGDASVQLDFADPDQTALILQLI